MGKSKNLLENEREQIVRLRKQSKSFTEIANIAGRSETASKQAWYKFSKAGMYCDRPKNGRPRKTTPKMDRRINRSSEKDRFRSANNVAAEINYKNHTQISARTVRRRLDDFDLSGRKPQKKPLLSSRNRKRQLAFAKAHKHWTSERYRFRKNRNSIAFLLTGYGMLNIELAKIRKHSAF
ncbi:uncharacterized protein LOC122571397 [Bombus pyrosoma]|uniref:uncharacterized protein LOC122571397 n=1 Tax=Bombus pyrosoma TaxID=396416 RepID=UPI001CB93B16|nr:uncharacterized protein LOC122571397 [Bombus pyrosoma]